MNSFLYDDEPCELGEGPLWHPERGQLFWFDIVGMRLHRREGSRRITHQFDEHVSAAGWIDDNALLVASESRLMRVDVATGAIEDICSLEADDPRTRSNDGRADPWGGFWIGTMGKKAEPGLGAIYRYYRGELRQLYAPISISNAICFSPDWTYGYFTDTPTQKIMRQRLDPQDGWPAGAPELWLDLSATKWRPDGAVVDADGNFWNAQWGGHRVACYAPDGAFLRAVTFPIAHTSCPAFGGSDLSMLFCTSARQGIAARILKTSPEQGMVFAARNIARGQAEHRVIL
jgi:sugar lactone lactonase YvrE